jgi:hypothetical protein
LSFQNPRTAAALLDAWYAFDILRGLDESERDFLHKMFSRRQVFAHCGGRVDQEYLDRYAEVLTMRREMLAEFGRILGDDPRLLARYLDLVKRRRSSLRDQLSELAKWQKETFGELSGWQSADAAQRDDQRLCDEWQRHADL